jgi:hypothetical protein
MLKSHPVISFYRKIPSPVKLIIVLFLVFFELSFLTVSAKKKQEIIHYLSTYENRMYGTSNLYELAESSGFKVKKHLTDLQNGIPDNASVIFILSPEYVYSSTEIDQIRKWIEDGGLLVYGSDMGPILNEDIKRPVFFQLYIDEDLPYFQQTLFGEKEESVKYQYRGKGPEVMMTRLEPDKSLSVFDNVSDIQVPLVAADNTLYRLHYDYTLETPFDAFLNRKQSKPQDDSSGNTANAKEEKWKTLASEDKHPSIVEYELGEGKLIAFSNPLLLSNGFIEAGDNIVLAYNLLSTAEKGSLVLFDEHCHGYTGAGKNTPISQTGWGRMLLFLLLTGILAIYSKSLRFIPPRAIPPPARKSQVEYLKSMAQILRRARANRILARILLRDIRNYPADIPEVRNLTNKLKFEVDSERPSAREILDAYNTMRSLEKKYQVKIDRFK